MQRSIILLAVLAAITLQMSAAATAGMRKLVRVRKDTRVDGRYLVHMKPSVEVEEIREYIIEMEQKADNDSTFVFRLFGILDQAAHGFSCELSKKALNEVRE